MTEPLEKNKRLTPKNTAMIRKTQPMARDGFHCVDTIRAMPISKNRIMTWHVKENSFKEVCVSMVSTVIA